MVDVRKESKGKVLAIIPARGGSEGIPRKNIASLGGIPLIAWSIRAAQESGVVDTILVSTEDDEIAEISKAWGAEVPFKRPFALAQSDSDVAAAVVHAVDELEAQGRFFDVILKLFPTHPFRTPEVIAEAVRLCKTCASSVETVEQYQWNPEEWFYIEQTKAKQISSRQKGLVYKFNALALASVRMPLDLPKAAGVERVKAAMRYTHAGDYRFSSGNRYIVINDPVMTLDIDFQEDLHQAERLIREGVLSWAPKEVRLGEKAPFEVVASRGALESEVLNVFTVDALGATNPTDVQMSLEEIKTPFQVKAILQERGVSPRAAILIEKASAKREFLSEGLPSVPTLVLERDRRLPVGTGKVFHRLDRVRLYVNKDLENEFGKSFGSLTSVKNSETTFTVTLNSEAHADDMLYLRLCSNEFKILATVMVFDSGFWTSANQKLEGLEVVGDGKRVEVSIDPSAHYVLVDHLRPGPSKGSESEQIVDIEVENLIRFDYSIHKWINCLTGEVILGRQALPPIFKCSGVWFLPESVSRESDWHVLEGSC